MEFYSFEIGPSTSYRLQQKPFHLLSQPDSKNISVNFYVDNIITIVLAINKKYIERSKQAVPLALHCIFRPISQSEPIVRDAILSIRKLLG